MRKNPYTKLLLLAALGASHALYAVTISAEEFFTLYAYPVKELASCPGLSFTTPNVLEGLTVAFTFTDGVPQLFTNAAPSTPGCTGTTLGAQVDVEAPCPSPHYQPNQLYCINNAPGLALLSGLATPGALATCIQEENTAGKQGAGVSCDAQNICTYTSAVGPSFTMTGPAC